MDYIDLPDLPQSCQICQAAWPSKVVAVGLHTTSTLEVPPVVFFACEFWMDGGPKEGLFRFFFACVHRENVCVCVFVV